MEKRACAGGGHIKSTGQKVILKTGIHSTPSRISAQGSGEMEGAVGRQEGERGRDDRGAKGNLSGQHHQQRARQAIRQWGPLKKENVKLVMNIGLEELIQA